MDFLTLSKERYTAKHYDVNRKISNEDLDKLLEIVRSFLQVSKCSGLEVLCRFQSLWQKLCQRFAILTEIE